MCGVQVLVVVAMSMWRALWTLMLRTTGNGAPALPPIMTRFLSVGSMLEAGPNHPPTPSDDNYRYIMCDETLCGVASAHAHAVCWKLSTPSPRPGRETTHDWTSVAT